MGERIILKWILKKYDCGGGAGMDWIFDTQKSGQ
jgi:hypothetical protein